MNVSSIMNESLENPDNFAFDNKKLFTNLVHQFVALASSSDDHLFPIQ